MRSAAWKCFGLRWGLMLVLMVAAVRVPESPCAEFGSPKPTTTADVHVRRIRTVASVGRLTSARPVSPMMSGGKHRPTRGSRVTTLSEPVQERPSALTRGSANVPTRVLTPLRC